MSSDGVSEGCRRATVVWGLYGLVLSCVLLDVRFYEYAKQARLCSGHSVSCFLVSYMILFRFQHGKANNK